MVIATPFSLSEGFHLRNDLLLGCIVQVYSDFVCGKTFEIFVSFRIWSMRKATQLLCRKLVMFSRTCKAVHYPGSLTPVRPPRGGTLR